MTGCQTSCRRDLSVIMHIDATGVSFWTSGFGQSVAGSTRSCGPPAELRGAGCAGRYGQLPSGQKHPASSDEHSNTYISHGDSADPRPLTDHQHLRSQLRASLRDVDAVDGARFRTILGYFPTGVTIVAGNTDDGPEGLTIGSFTSVSLDPPLVGFLPTASSTSWRAIAASGKFCVNVLGTNHGELCWRFARRSERDRFTGVDWKPSPLGSPIIDGAVAWIDCTIEETCLMGDHEFILGRVRHLDHGNHLALDPLVFLRGRLGGFAEFD